MPLQEAPFNFAVAFRACEIELPQNAVGDILLAATALVFELTLVTADAQLIECPRLKTLANATLTLDPEDRLPDDQYFDFRMANPDINFERTAQGEIVIEPPAGPESDHRTADAIASRRMDQKGRPRQIRRRRCAVFVFPTARPVPPDAA